MKTNSRKTLFKLVNLLRQKKLTVSLAESATCGMLAQQFNTVPGTHDILLGSIVCYHESVKTDLLHVKPGLIAKYTAESMQVTEAITTGLKKVIPAEIMIGVTGLAAGKREGKQKELPGTMFLTILYKGKLKKYKRRFLGSPLEIKMKCCRFIFGELLKIIT
jgi:nicotinamide-nucleotide amidase